MKKNLILFMLLALVLTLTSCTKEEDMKNNNLELIKDSITCDVSSYEARDNFKLTGNISVYAAKPYEWFIIEDKNSNKTYGFVILDNTKICDNKNKELKHSMFNVGTNDIVEVNTLCQCGSIYEEYNDIDGWFIAKSIKEIDTLEY